MIIAGSCPHCNKPLGMSINIEKLDSLNNQEREISEVGPKHLTGEEGKKQFLDIIHSKQDARQKSIGVSGNPKSILDKARKQEQKEEFEGAKQTLASYHARKAKKLNKNPIENSTSSDPEAPSPRY
jgi:hypothetical protein